jgi:hypothetical protein
LKSRFFSLTPNINIVKQLFEKLNLNEKDVIKIEYRGNGWPGGFTAYMKNGSTKYVSSKHYFPNDLNNAPQCCKSCSEVSKWDDKNSNKCHDKSHSIFIPILSKD